jgi:hypothetical protein
MWSASMWLVITIGDPAVSCRAAGRSAASDRVVDARRSAVDQHAHGRSGRRLLVVQDEAIAVVGLQRLSVNTTANSLSTD